MERSILILDAQHDLVLTKSHTWTADGWTTQSYDNAKEYTHSTVNFTSLDQLMDILRVIQDSPSKAVVHGAVKPPAQKVMRRLLHDRDGYSATITDAPQGWVMLDVDDIKPPAGIDQRTDPEGAALYVVSQLPAALHDVDFVYQCSASAGLSDDTPVKVHLWYLLSTPETSKDLKAWASDAGLSHMVDTSLFSAAQIHYTAKPLFTGAPDPIKTRLGLVRGAKRALVLQGFPTFLEEQVSRVAGATENRNNTLNDAAFHLGVHMALGGHSRTPVEAALLEAAVSCGLGKAEAEATIQSGLDAGQAKAPTGAAPLQQAYFAQLLANQSDGKILNIPKLGGFYYHTGTHYKEDETDEHFRAIQGLLFSEYSKAETAYQAAKDPDEKKAKRAWKTKVANLQNFSNISGIAKIFGSQKSVRKSQSDFDVDPWALNTPAGLIDLRTGEVSSHQKHLVTKVTGCAPRSMPTPLFDAFLDKTFAGDKDLIRFMQLAMGYAATGLTSEERLLIFYGSGKNGKSQFIDTMRHVLGDYCTSVSPNVLMTKGQNNAVEAEKAGLRGARLVSAMEPPQSSKMNDSLLKQLSSTDLMTARYLGKNPFTFKPTHQLVLVTNHKPEIKTTDEGTWRRVLLVHFNQEVPEKDRVPQYADVLFAKEGPGILQWAVDGSMRYFKEGFHPPEAVKLATQEYRSEENEIENFLADCTVEDPDGAVRAAAIYSVYRNWCADQGSRGLSHRDFGASLGCVVKKKQRKDGAFYMGISLNSDYNNVLPFKRERVPF